MAFPFLDLVSQYKDIREETEAAVKNIFESGRFIMGEAVSGFETAMTDYCGVSEAVGVDSGTRALELIYRALDIGPGDEVITTPFTFFATISTILQVGATPVFADIKPDTLNLDPAAVAQKITGRTRAITPVHLFGLPADMEALRAAAGNIPIIEDACQAAGASYRGQPAGSLGAAAALSFFPTKNLGGAGDGGMVLTSDGELAEKVRMFRNHGSKRRYYHDAVGCTGRLDALQAAVLQVKLKYLDGWNKKRQEHAGQYSEGLREWLQVPVVPEERSHVFHQYTLRADGEQERDALVEHLQASDIPVAVYYPVSQHLQPACSPLGYREGSMPESESAARTVLSLPICPYLREDNRDRVIEVIGDFFRKNGKNKFREQG